MASETLHMVVSADLRPLTESVNDAKDMLTVRTATTPKERQLAYDRFFARSLLVASDYYERRANHSTGLRRRIHQFHADLLKKHAGIPGMP